jgi:hypothetical protein
MPIPTALDVIPAEAGISARTAETVLPEIPAFAGMTGKGQRGASVVTERA